MVLDALNPDIFAGTINGNNFRDACGREAKIFLQMCGCTGGYLASPGVLDVKKNMAKLLAFTTHTGTEIAPMISNSATPQTSLQKVDALQEL